MFKTKEGILNFVYSIGAAIVVLGALVKITHISIPGVSGNFILGFGLAVEALIFVLFAFNPPADENKYSWENVYPELLDPNAESKPRKVVEKISYQALSNVSGADGALSEKLDKMLEEAKLDAAVFEKLQAGIDRLSTSVEQMNQSAEQSEKFNQELKNLTDNLNNLNKVYGNMLNAMKS